MSAWDIAGAVVWTLSAAVWWTTVIRIAGHSDELTPGQSLTAIVVGVALPLASVFCIARLLGAHA